VDFSLRRELLDRVAVLSPEGVMAGMDQGLPKLWIIRQALHLRRSQPESFGPQGTYRPLTAQGPGREHVVAFVRGERAVTVAPRLILGLEDDWRETSLELPEGAWHNVLTGEEGLTGRVYLRDILARFPVGLFS